MSETVHPRWDAINEKGEIVGSWIETPGAKERHSPDWIRWCRDQYYPGTRLRVTRMVPVTHWDGEEQPGILVLPPGLTYDPDFLLKGVWTVTSSNLEEQGRRLASEREDLIAQGVDPSELEVPIHPQDHPDTPSSHGGSEDVEDPWPGLDN